MKYLAEFLNRNSADTWEGYPTKPTKPARESPDPEPTTTLDFRGYLEGLPYETYETPFDASSVGSVGNTDQVAAEIQVADPPAVPWLRPAELEDWPIEWRQKFGERANELNDVGVPMREDERLAFAEVKALKDDGKPIGTALSVTPAPSRAAEVPA